MVLKDSNCTTIYIVRHGETEHNVNRVTQGHTDSFLTPNGIKQAENLSKLFKDIKFDIVFSSDLPRAQKTAGIIISNRDLNINKTEALRERDYGRYDGRPSSIFIEENKEIIERVKTLHKSERRKVKFAHDIESDEEINNRLVNFLKEIIPIHTGKTILVTTHGGVMRAFLNHLEWNGEEELRSGAIKNTGYIKLNSDGENFFIEEVNGVER